MNYHTEPAAHLAMIAAMDSIRNVDGTFNGKKYAKVLAAVCHKASGRSH